VSLGRASRRSAVPATQRSMPPRVEDPRRRAPLAELPRADPKCRANGAPRPDPASSPRLQPRAGAVDARPPGPGRVGTLLRRPRRVGQRAASRPRGTGRRHPARQGRGCLRWRGQASGDDGPARSFPIRLPGGGARGGAFDSRHPARRAPGNDVRPAADRGVRAARGSSTHRAATARLKRPRVNQAPHRTRECVCPARFRRPCGHAGGHRLVLAVTASLEHAAFARPGIVFEHFKGELKWPRT
jgi:hypothetical protein